jgi:hypothetical protein
MTFSRTLSQGPITINYAVSNHLFYRAVERTYNTLVSRASHEDRPGKRGSHYPFIFNILTNKMQYSKYNKSDNKAHFVIGTNFYTFLHQGTTLRDFITKKDRKSKTYVGATRNCPFVCFRQWYGSTSKYATLCSDGMDRQIVVTNQRLLNLVN